MACCHVPPLFPLALSVSIPSLLARIEEKEGPTQQTEPEAVISEEPEQQRGFLDLAPEEILTGLAEGATSLATGAAGTVAAGFGGLASIPFADTPEGGTRAGDISEVLTFTNMPNWKTLSLANRRSWKFILV